MINFALPPDPTMEFALFEQSVLDMDAALLNFNNSDTRDLCCQSNKN